MSNVEQTGTIIIGFPSEGMEEAKLCIKGYPVQLQQLALILEGKLPALMAWESDVFEAVSYLMAAFTSTEITVQLLDSSKPKTEEHF